MLVIFDCDGVLVDSEIIACGIEAEELTRIGYPITLPEEIARFAGKSQKAMKAVVEEALGRPLPEGFLAHLNARILEALGRDLKAMPGINVALGMIANKCVASSGAPEKIENSLRTTGLSRHFGDGYIFSATMVKNGKPAPDLFLYAAQRMGFAPQNCVVVEDSLYGTKAGVAAGMTVFGFTGGTHIIDPKHAEALKQAGAKLVFNDMARLPELLKTGV